jgi:hypothetical protein
MPFEGLLEGLMAGTAEHVSAERENVRREEELTLAQRKGYLDFLLQGMTEGRVNPEFFARAWADAAASATPSSGRKRAKGTRGFLGGTDLPEMPFFDAVMSGQIPMQTRQPKSVGSGRTPAAEAAPSPVPSGERDTPLDAVPGGGLPVPLPPRLPGRGDMPGAARDLASDVQQNGPQMPAPTSRGLILRPEERAMDELGGMHSVLTQLLGPELGQRTFITKLAGSQATPGKQQDDYVDPTGKIIAKVALDPTGSGGLVFLHDVDLGDGRFARRGSEVPPGWRPFYLPGNATNAGGMTTGFDRVTGQPLWTGQYGRATPAFGFPIQVPDANSPSGFSYFTPNRFTGGASPTRGPGGTALAAPDRPEQTTINVSAADAQQMLEVLEAAASRTLEAEAITKTSQWMDKLAQQRWGITLAEIETAAGRSARRPKPRGGAGPQSDGSQGRGLTPPPASRPGEPQKQEKELSDDDFGVFAYLQTEQGKKVIAKAGGVDAARAQLLARPELLAQVRAWYRQQATAGGPGSRPR